MKGTKGRCGNKVCYTGLNKHHLPLAGDIPVVENCIVTIIIVVHSQSLLEGVLCEILC